MGRMAQIAESRGVAIHINEENFFSFANSPYYAHERISAVDVYPPRGELEALSPVEGPVLFVKPLSSGKDYALTIKVGEGLCVKILHVKPRVKTGEKVRVGDYLGKIVWSPFYNFWTDRHMHVEVRPIADPLRARGGFELDVSPLLAKMRLESLQASRGPRPFKVDLVKSEYALLKTPGGEAAFASPIAVKGGGFVGYVEGGLPHYGHGALVGTIGQPAGALPFPELGGRATVDYVRRGYVHFRCERGRIRVDGKEYKGLSVYINDRWLKLVPVKPGGVEVKEGDELLLKL